MQLGFCSPLKRPPSAPAKLEGPSNLPQRTSNRAQHTRIAPVASLGHRGHSSNNSGWSSSGDGSGHAKVPERMLHALSSPERIGSEYGEGFIQFRFSGEQIHLDVEKLNEQLRSQGRDRMRQANYPDEAFGLIFNWDNVIANTRELQREAWKRLAAREGLHYPAIERQIFDISPLRAIIEVLQWASNVKRAQELSYELALCYAELLNEVSDPLPGVEDWLALVSKNNVPCALVTQMDRTTTHQILDRLNLRQYFNATVTADDDMETISQRFLSAAIKLGRPPEKCVVFAGCPASTVAAHNCTMRAVAILGPHTAPQLRNADLTVGSLKELSVYNIRRLFANKGAEFMDLRKGRVGSGPPRRTLRHATIDPEDEENGEEREREMEESEWWGRM